MSNDFDIKCNDQFSPLRAQRPQSVSQSGLLGEMGEKSALGTGGRQNRSESIKVQCSERGLKRNDRIPNRKPIMRVPKRFFGTRDFETGSLEFKALKMGVRFGIESLKGLLGTLYYTIVNQRAIPQFYCSWRIS